MSLDNHQKTNELRAWHFLLDDDSYRLDQPEHFYESLIQRADELVFRNVLNLEEWQALKCLADEVYGQTIAALQEGKRDRLDTRILRIRFANKT